MGFFSEFSQFLKKRKLWCIAPIIAVLMVLSFIIWFAESSAIAPFIYTLF